MTDEIPARASAVRKRLAQTLPEPPCELDFQSPWQLLIATILSAQSTDKMVNKTTPALFAKYPTPAALAAAPQVDVEILVKSTGFFRNKAKAIRAASQVLVDHFGGEVPRDPEDLMRCPGVARKTANVVLGTAYGIATGVTVDTHVGRVARRLELTQHDDPEKVERDLMQLFPKKEWVKMGHRLVLHGRYVCLARKPACATCPLTEVCPSAEAKGQMRWTERAARENRLVLSRGEVREGVESGEGGVSGESEGTGGPEESSATGMGMPTGVRRKRLVSRSGSQPRSSSSVTPESTARPRRR